MHLGITKYHHFQFKKDEIICKQFVDSEEETFHLRLWDEVPSSDNLPTLIIPDGLSLARKWYLYDNIRSLCSDPEKRDFVAPKPDQPKVKQESTAKSTEKRKQKVESKAQKKVKTEAPKKKQTEASKNRKTKASKKKIPQASKENNAKVPRKINAKNKKKK